MATFLKWSRSGLFFGFTFALLLLLLFAPVLFSPQNLVLSLFGTDLFAFAPWRAFGFGHLRGGDLPLWNPHVFSGTPFVSNFQTGMFYPVNWVHMLLPPDKAINVEIICNLLLGACGMFLWTRYRGLHTVACWLAPILWVFGAPFFLKISAGHLAPLGAMCWIPWLLWAADLIRDRSLRRGALLAAFAVTMQILAGHPQTVFNSAITIALYSLFAFAGSSGPAAKPTARGRAFALSVGTIGVAYALAATIAAVQLLPGLAMAAESSRSGGVPLHFAQMFSLPPENFLTLLAPGFFGQPSVGNISSAYWGRAYLWEMSLFMGIGTVALIGHALITRAKEIAPLGFVVVVLLVLASGKHTPLFQWLYDYFPGFNKFRGHSKFIVPAAALMSLMAAYGLHELLATSRRVKVTGAGLATLALLCGGAGVWLLSRDANWWQSALTRFLSYGENYALPQMLAAPQFAAEAGTRAAQSLLIAGATCFALAIFWFWRLKERRAAYVIAGITTLELLVFARMNCPAFPYQVLVPPDLRQFVQEQNPGTDRMLAINANNSAILNGALDIWGYDPSVLGRYLDFMAWTQGKGSEVVNAADVNFASYHRLYAMLRCRYIGVPTARGMQFGVTKGALPPLLLLDNYRVMESRDAIFAAMQDAAFDPARTIILEKEPHPKPDTKGQPAGQPAASGTARILHSSPDAMLIEAHVVRPAILLITDSFSQGWTVEPEAKSADGKAAAQSRYDVMPANYVLRAVPLAAGEHRFWMRYEPRSFYTGIWITALGLIIFSAVGMWPYLLTRRRSRVNGITIDDVDKGNLRLSPVVPPSQKGNASAVES